MGDVADAMLDGTLCEGCGEYLDRAPQGFPGYCSAECARGRGMEYTPPAVRHAGRSRRGKRVETTAKGTNRGTYACPQGCGMTFKNPNAAAQHARDKHKVAP